ncbi:MAG: hypothetical protein ABIF87_17180 [Pseudomonadota bacterium]
MNKRSVFLFILVFVGVMFFSLNTHAATAVTISVESGPTFTEEGITGVDLIVPERPSESLPLVVGDKVFFVAAEPFFLGEGTITNLYETTDETITKAVIVNQINQ